MSVFALTVFGFSKTSHFYFNMEALFLVIKNSDSSICCFRHVKNARISIINKFMWFNKKSLFALFLSNCLRTQRNVIQTSLQRSAINFRFTSLSSYLVVMRCRICFTSLGWVSSQKTGPKTSNLHISDQIFSASTKNWVDSQIQA